MSVAVQTLYNAVAAVMLEPNGFVLGVFTDAQFLNALSVVMLDFSQRATLNQKIYTQQIYSGTGVYVVPEDIIEPELCFIGGRLIEKVTEDDLTRGHLGWQLETGMPRQWHEDNLPVKRLELYPIPDFNGGAIAGGAVYGDFAPSTRNLTIVGPAASSKTSWTLDDTLDTIPDSFTYYLAYGILEQIFSAEGETRDEQRAAYCHARWDEGISLSNSIVHEELEEDE